MSKPFVVILEDSSKAGFGGGQKVTLAVVKLLGTDFELAVFDTAKKTIFNQSLKTEIRKKYYLAEVPFFYIRGFSQIIALLLLPFQLLLNIFIVTIFINKIKKTNSSVLLYSTTKKTIVISYFVSVLSGVKYIHHLHSFENINKIQFKLKSFIYQKAALLISVSDFIFKSFPYKNNTLIYNPVAIISNGKYKSIAQKSTFNIVTFTSLIPQKGIIYLMNAYNFLNNDLKQKVNIKIYGDGKEKEKLKLLENNHVTLMGFCKDPNIVLKEIADITVIPSIIPESFGLQAIESFMYGVPVIATNEGALPEIVKNGYNGFIINKKDSLQIAEKISTLLNNQELYSKLSENAVSTVKKYDINIFEEKMKAVFISSIN